MSEIENLKIEKLRRERDILAKGILEIDNLIGESSGVGGFHLNGDFAEWDEVLGEDFRNASRLADAVARGGFSDR